MDLHPCGYYYEADIVIAYVNDGQLVEAKVGDRWLLCRVACAAGDLARVVNPLHRVDLWLRLDEMRAAPSTVQQEAD